MVFWVVTGTLLCVQVISQVASRARSEGDRGGWKWLIVTPLLISMLFNWKGALTRSLTYGRYDPALIPAMLLFMGGAATVALPVLISAESAVGKLKYYGEC